jgi:hypothetical protein
VTLDQRAVRTGRAWITRGICNRGAIVTDQASQPTVPNAEVWTCAECGVEVTGATAPKRSWLVRNRLRAAGEGAILTRCVSCGKTLCQSCAKRVLKGGWPLANRNSPCPQCGAKFGDGPILVPAAWAADYDRAGIGLEAAAYARTLKTWSKWIIFWSVLNGGGVLSTLLAGRQSDDALASQSPEALAVFFLAVSLVALVASIACLASRIPWAGFYVVFSLYLVLVGVMNVWEGNGFWRAAGIVQILLGLWCMRDAARYAEARHKSGR